MNETEGYKFINTFWLKIIAILTMTIDHTAVCFGLLYENDGVYLSQNLSPDTYELMRSIGRIAFPIFCYLITEGLFYTKSIKKYILRLAIFALVSQVPFNLLLYKEPLAAGSNLNVYFTLCIGLTAIAILKATRELFTETGNTGYSLVGAASVFCAIALAEMLHTDYGGFGIILIILFYLYKDKPIKIFIAVTISILLFSGLNELYALIGLIPIFLHNKERGPGLKYFFYLYYPVHMLSLYFIYNSIF